jgi:hypothetical protein
MAVSMAAMMAPTAAPFFFAYGRDTRRPAAVAIAVAIYLGVWAVVGALAGVLMGAVMMPSSPVIAVAAIGLAVAYSLTPWSRRARTRCAEMSRRAPRGPRLGDALLDGWTYASCCLVCTAGVMAAIVVLGMSNLVVVVAAAAAIALYKLI